MSHIFPALQTYTDEILQVGDIHRIYLEQSGNPDGLPVLFLHGGPGAGLNQSYRSLFDPDQYRIIGFDQRGCGRSKPFAETKQNNTAALIDDIEAIRQHLNIDSWIVAGGSWGSTLALLYAIKHASKVNGLILRGIFLARQQDRDWFLSADGGAAQMFPEYYQDFIAPVKSRTGEEDLLTLYSKALNSDNELTVTAAAKAWSQWEERIAKLNHKEADEELGHMRERIAIARLECHYIQHQCFVEENYILDNVAKLGDIPVTIVHGRYDVVCKLEAAYTLHQGLANSQLFIIPEAGHSMSEMPIANALCHASNAMAKFFKEQKQ